MKSSLDRVTELENDEVWRDSRSPEKEEDFLNSPFHMDIWTVQHNELLYFIEILRMRYDAFVSSKLRVKNLKTCML